MKDNRNKNGLFVKANIKLLLVSLISQLLLIASSVATLMQENLPAWKIWFSSIGCVVFLIFFIVTVYHLLKFKEDKSVKKRQQETITTI